MKKVLTALMICGILGFGFSTDKAEASESALTPDLPEIQELKKPWREPPPPPPRPGPRPHDDWYGPPPPPPRPGPKPHDDWYGPPPPPPDGGRRHHPPRW